MNGWNWTELGGWIGLLDREVLTGILVGKGRFIVFSRWPEGGLSESILRISVYFAFRFADTLMRGDAKSPIACTCS